MIELPAIIRLAAGCSSELPDYLKGAAVLLLCGRHSLAKVEQEVIPQLESSGKRVETVIIPPELPLQVICDTVTRYRNCGISDIIGWGGGSAMDGAKALAPLLTAPESPEKYFYGEAKLPPRRINLILLPTTAGTGAEVTPNAVLRDEKSGIKQSLRGSNMQADAALIDPLLLRGTPAKVMAASGFDAFTQAVESFVSNRADTLTRGMSLMGAQLIFSELAAGCRGEERAFEALCRGTVLGAMAFAQCGLGAVHGIAHPLGSVLNLGHGAACAALLVPVMEMNRIRVPEIYADLARGLGFADCGKLCAAVKELLRELGLPEKLASYGLSRDKFPFIVKNCRSGSMRCNPCELSDAEVELLLEELL